jgi:hypothetical protein
MGVDNAWGLKGSRWDPLTKENPQEGLGAQGRTINAYSHELNYRTEIPFQRGLRPVVSPLIFLDISATPRVP